MFRFLFKRDLAPLFSCRNARNAQKGMFSMAESLEDFYVRLGLDMSELKSGFVEANRTITENISRLNRESNLIQIRSQVEIAGLDETTDAERILQIRTDALNQRMAIQRDRVRLVSAELRNLTQEYGENHIVTQRAAQRLEQTRLALANMEREMRNLTSSQNTESLVRFNAVLSGIGEGLSGFLRADITSLIEAMPPQLKAIAAGITAVGTGAGMAGKSVEALLEDFRELHNQAYELNMSIGKTRDFLRQLRLGGGDIGDFEGYIRGITDAFVKGEVDDPEFIALRKYGAEITDVTGRLKDFKDLTEEVYQAWKKADEAGEGIEFLQLTGGEAGVRDAIQFFKRYEEAVSDAQKVMKAGIDDSQLHELDRVMKLVEEQAGELKNALGDIFVPAAQSAAEGFFETLHKGTEFLVENKEEIQRWGFIAKEAFSTAGDKISEVFEAAGKKISEVNELLKGKTGDSRVDKILGDMSWRYGGTQPAYGIDKMISGQVESAKKSLGVLDEFIKKGEQAQAEYNAEVSKTSELWQKVVKTISGGDKNPLNQYALQRVQQFKDELADLRIELDFDDEIEKARARLNQWFDKEFTRKNFLSDDEKKAIQELYSAKLEQIDKERIQNIKNAEKELSANLQSLHNTELENRLAQINKEKQAWLDKCNDEVKATQWAEQAKADAQRNAAMATLRQQAEEYDVYQKGGYAGLRAYKAEQLAAQGVNPKYLYITPEQLADFQKANQVAEKSMLPNLMTDYDRAEHAQQMQNWRNFTNQLNAERDKQNYVIVDGIKKGISEILHGIEFEYGKNVRDERHTMKLSSEGDRYTSRDDKYSYDNDGRLSQQDTTIKNAELPTIQVPENYQEILQSVQGVSDSFSEIAPNVQSAAETFGELPVAVQGVTESLSGLEMPQLEGVENIFSSMEPEIQNLAQQFSAINVSGENFAQQISSMCMGVDEVTVKLSDLSAAIQNFSLPNENSATEKVPVEVNTTVQIDEAHAWDYDHIQELAEKVADVLEPRIISAIGGDSNSY